MSIPQLDGPLIRLDKHPSRHRYNDTNSREVPHSSLGDHGGIPRVVLSGGDTGNYEQIIHFDDYVLMKPVESMRVISTPTPVARRNPPLPSDDTYHHLQQPNVNHSVPKNYPLPRELKGVSTDYKPTYQNVTHR